MNLLLSSCVFCELCISVSFSTAAPPSFASWLSPEGCTRVCVQALHWRARLRGSAQSSPSRLASEESVPVSWTCAQVLRGNQLSFFSSRDRDGPGRCSPQLRV